MKPIKHKYCNAILGTNQPGVHPLPAYVGGDCVVCCFALNREERKRVAEKGEIWISLQSHNHQINPIYLATRASEILTVEDD